MTSAGAGAGHGRVDAERPGLVGRGRNDAPWAAAAHDDRAATQFGPPEQLHGHEERIHVDVEDPRVHVLGAIAPARLGLRHGHGRDETVRVERSRPATW